MATITYSDSSEPDLHESDPEDIYDSDTSPSSTAEDAASSGSAASAASALSRCSISEKPATPIPPRARIIDLGTHRTFAYTKALQNRINESITTTGQVWDLEAIRPVFVFDVLQLPNTLAEVLNHQSPLEVVDHMTRATLVGPRSVVQRLWYAHSESTYGLDLKGMAVFGVIKRDAIDDFYQGAFEMAEVEVDLVFEGGEGRRVTAYAWIPREAVEGAGLGDFDEVEW